MFKAVIFDFDGVIADTMNDNFNAWEYSFLKYNVKIEKKDYFILEGMGPKSIANNFIDRNNLDKKLLSKIILEKEKFYKKNNQFKVYTEIYSIFNFLIEKNILIGIVTGASKERLISTLDKKLIAQTSVLITSDDVIKTKPDPEPYLVAIDKLNLSSTNCLVIENAILGIKSAKSAGCTCYAISTTLSEEYLLESDISFKSHSGLVQYLFKLFEKTI
jgi:beta-phosphoglucomutase